MPGVDETLAAGSPWSRSSIDPPIGINCIGGLMDLEPSNILVLPPITGLAIPLTYQLWCNGMI